MRPYPAEIAQNENQLVVYEGNAHLFSLYKTEKVKTTIKLASERVESYSKQPKPASISGRTVTYGAYKSIEKLSWKPISIHFENNKPFTLVKKLEREIQVSHWGSISVEERWEVEHRGAKLKTGFSRLDFTRYGHRSASVAGFHQFLPKGTRDIYYRDIIGNISTSNAFTRSDGTVDFEIRPRFVLFGGWRVVFKTGYSLPTSLYLLSNPQSPSSLYLNFSLFDPIDNFPVDSLTVSLVLPEGTS